ncbi:MAG: nicotinate-nucleotide--dimethylbenzimidazole phosphoribosyltransferase, partial [Chloroflexi bacterium]|nr:nicotinate-nucleotide--dimethylbenzimidazole phosphoribosyltransferase [Chloroflexota bacterium]
ARQDRLTKPRGSLGRLEDLAVALAGMRGEVPRSLPRRAVVVMAADHGVAAEGVSAYPASVTAQMVANFASGGAAINVLARVAGARLRVVDMGVGTGTANMRRAPALSREAAERALLRGAAVLDEEADAGLDLVATGEMGIANTTAASAIAAALTGMPVAEVVGRGSGIDGAGLARKVAVIEDALRLHRPGPGDPLGVLTAVGGLEIAGLAGLVLRAAGRRIPVVLDGFISGAAAAVADALAPACRPYLIAAHRSAEPGHQALLARLGLSPLLDLGLRLGEGSGAALGLPLVEAAARIHHEMATFGEAGVDEQS